MVSQTLKNSLNKMKLFENLFSGSLPVSILGEALHNQLIVSYHTRLLHDPGWLHLVSPPTCI